MKNTVKCITKNSNCYLYNLDFSLLMWIHPELAKVCDGELNIDSYYHSKYLYLKKYGFFKDCEAVEFSTNIDKTVIENNIVNVPQIVFETTDFCNLNCSYCSLGDLYSFSKPKKRNINFEKAKHLLEYIYGIKPKGETLGIGFFGGEPLVNGEFVINIVNEAKLLNREGKVNLLFYITTNAVLLDRYLDFLVENKFNILISLDGDEIGQSYRKLANNDKNSFKKVISNIDLLYNKYPSYFANHVEFNSVLTNKNSVKRIYEFIYERYHKIPSIAQLNTDHVNPGREKLMKEIFSDKKNSERLFIESNSKLMPVVKDKLMIYNEVKKFITNNSINFYICNILDLLYNEIVSIPTKTCSPFQRKIFLNTYNKILPCEKVSYKYFMGEVNSGDININFEDVIKRFHFYYEHIKPICKNCYNRRSCSICLLTLENLNKIDTNDFACPNYMSEKDFSNKLGEIFSLLESNSDDFIEMISDNLSV